MEPMTRFEGFNPLNPYLSPVALAPKPSPEFFLPRLPFLLPHMANFMHRPNEIPVIQTPGLRSPTKPSTPTREPASPPEALSKETTA